MSARDYSVAQRPSRSFTRASAIIPSDETSHISARRRLRIQVQTDLYLHLDCNPKHPQRPCAEVYELEDRTQPSISSF